MNKLGTIAAIITAGLLTAVVNPCKTPDKENPAPENKSTALTVKNVINEIKENLFNAFYVPGECPPEEIKCRNTCPENCEIKTLENQLTCNSGSKGSANGAIDTERLEKKAEDERIIFQ